METSSNSAVKTISMRQTLTTFAGGLIAPDSPRDDVRLDSVEVTFHFDLGTYVTDAVFKLFNTGDTVNVPVGFPKNGYGRMRYDYVEEDRPPEFRDFIRFQGWVNGRPVNFTGHSLFTGETGNMFPESYEKKTTKWIVKDITFRAHSFTVIRVQYEAPYGRSTFSVRNRAVTFYLSTGRNWKGNIGKIEFLIDDRELYPIRSKIITNWKGYGRERVK
jgi:hypothetical protein